MEKKIGGCQICAEQLLLNDLRRKMGPQEMAQLTKFAQLTALHKG